jgi:hypothetical protein
MCLFDYFNNYGCNYVNYLSLLNALLNRGGLRPGSAWSDKQARDVQTSHLGQVVQICFWRTTSSQTHQIRLVYTTDKCFKRLGPYITHSPVALSFLPIQGKRRERLHDVLPIKIHCRVIWHRN